MTRAAALVLSLLIALPAVADVVTPSDRVRSSVRVRGDATAGSSQIASLRPGEEATLVATGDEWHRVRLHDGRHGFVSARWTRVVQRGPQGRALVEAVDLPGTGGVWRSLGRFFTSTLPTFLRLRPRVDFFFREPQPGRSIREHYDPSLPVAGLAAIPGSSGLYDIILAIDLSTSTSEYAKADVDGDGVFENGWHGDDSIFRAQLAASRGFIRAVHRLPGNREGRRIRVGLITFAGDERFHRSPGDRRFDADPKSVFELALRDSELRVPLTSDYDALEQALRDLSGARPAGMTDFAAGIGRAVIELVGIEALGARSSPRPDAERIVHFMTDGKPRLPYDRQRGEYVGGYAAGLAARMDVRINAFSLGRNPVTREVNPTLRRITWRSGGRLVELEHPGDVISILRTTSFSFVERVRLLNRTTDHESGSIATGIDGSFYGEVPLTEGENEIRVVAVLYDGRKATEDFTVDFRLVPPDPKLAERLQKIREDNQALVDRLKDDLTQDMQHDKRRRAGQRTLEIRTEEPESKDEG